MSALVRSVRLYGTPCAACGHSRRHPLATRSGLALMLELIAADTAWSACTKPQRSLLSILCAPVIAVLLETGRVKPVDLPMLPDTTRKSMREALVRRGMAAADGRVTGKAVHAYYYEVWVPAHPPEKRPEVTA